MEMKISELAKACDVNKETVRYYERKGLIAGPPRNESGYRIYSEETADRVRFIKRMKELDFSLKEIHLLLVWLIKMGRDVKICTPLPFKTKEIERKVQDLLRIQRLLEELKEKCPDEKAIYTCPIIETLIGGPDK